jgi:hypothetical protein
MTCSLSFVEIDSGSYSRCDKRHHLDLSRRSVATDQSPPTSTGSGTETDLLRSLRICTVSKKELENEPDREEADDSPQAALHVERN